MVNGDVLSYENLQTDFDRKTGSIADLGEGSPASGAPEAAPGAGDPAGWPIEFFETLHCVAFASLGEKWALNSEQARLLGLMGKRWWDTIRPPEKQGPGSGYLAALSTVLMAKIGLDQISKLKALIMPGSASSPAPSDTKTPASTSTGGFEGELLSAENLGAVSHL